MVCFSNRKKWLRYFSLLLPILLLLSIFCLGSVAKRDQKAISKQVLRLHIVGNTNSEVDQNLKLLVRDSILTKHKTVFAEADNRSDAILCAKQSIPQIKNTAEQTLQKHGCFAPVTVQVEETTFPTKHYGSVSLPAGRYTAVNVRIGNADGENWWCVLYPPLCLTEGTLNADEQTLQLLQSSLSPAEYSLITQPKKITFRMKFRILELLEKFFS